MWMGARRCIWTCLAASTPSPNKSPPALTQVHTEVLTDGVAELAQRGNVTCARKNFMRGKVVATLALGTRTLYDWMVREGQAGHWMEAGREV